MSINCQTHDVPALYLLEDGSHKWMIRNGSKMETELRATVRKKMKYIERQTTASSCNSSAVIKTQISNLV